MLLIHDHTDDYFLRNPAESHDMLQYVLHDNYRKHKYMHTAAIYKCSGNKLLHIAVTSYDTRYSRLKMAEREGDQSQAEDIERNANEVDGTTGEDFTDSYADTSGFIYIIRKLDYTGRRLDYYRIEVQPEKYTVQSQEEQLLEMPVTTMCKAELDLCKAFGYAYHRSTEAGWFMADSPEEVKSKSQEILKKWCNTN